MLMEEGREGRMDFGGKKWPFCMQRGTVNHASTCVVRGQGWLLTP